jgi:hypothetical protein
MKDKFNQIFIITHREGTKETLETSYGANVIEVKDNRIGD